MGNLVANRINFERRDGATGIAAFSRVVMRLTSVPFEEIQLRLERQDRPVRGVHVSFDMCRLAPQPAVLGEQGKGDLELGLAILSTSDRDLVHEFHALRDPASLDLPPHMVPTAYSVLSARGLAGLDRASRLAAARSRHSGALLAGYDALRAHEITGHFEAVTWRKSTWGVSAHGAEVSLWLEQGNLCARFDTVNEGPKGWLRDLAKALPGYQFSGVSYDESSDYSLHVVTEGPGEISIVESDDPDQVLAARAFNAGLSVAELLEEDRQYREEDDEPDTDPNP